MKKYYIFLCAALLLSACAKQPTVEVSDEPETPAVKNGVTFVTTFTKVSTTDGVNTWDTGDKSSVFSVADGAQAGESTGTNVSYQTEDSGASASFTAVDTPVPASNKYYAYYPSIASYPSKYNPDTNLGYANPSIGFEGAAANAAVTDYRFMPVFVNSGAIVTVDPATGKSVSDSQAFFWASADAPANETDPVALQFKPILPLLQFDLYGHGAIKKMTISFDKDTNPASNDKWMSGKGVFDLSTGKLTITNISNTAYFKFDVTLKQTDKEYVELRGTDPVTVKVSVGHFTVSDGLTLTFTTKDGNTIVKKIWENQTVSTKTDAGIVKHIRQGVNVPIPYVSSSVDILDEFASDGGTSDAFTVQTGSSWSVQSCPDWISLNPASGTGGESVVATASANTGSARSGIIVLQTPEGATCSIAVSQAAFQAAAANYYSVDVAGINWTSSFIYDIKNADNALIARITREFLGATQNVRVVAAYKAPSGNVDYTAGLVIDNGGSVSAWTKDPAKVSYTAGSSSSIATIWVKDDGSEILTTAPAGSVSPASISPYVLTSPSGQNHALVKIGNMIWTAEGYKTTKLGDGTSITTIPATGTTEEATPSSTVPNLTIYSNDGEDIYMYNALCVKGATDGLLAPDGWAVPSVNQWTVDLAGFLGGTSSYANMSVAQLFSRTCYKNVSNTAPQNIGYYNTWSNQEGKTPSSQWTMLMCQSGAAPRTANTQAYKSSFEIRLIKK